MTRQRTILGLAAVAIILVVAVSRPALAQSVNVNTASEAELAGVKGIGKKLAAKIVANRPYASAAELSKAGVSQKKIDQDRADVKFRGWRRRAGFRRGCFGCASGSRIACCPQA